MVLSLLLLLINALLNSFLPYKHVLKLNSHVINYNFIVQEFIYKCAEVDKSMEVLDRLCKINKTSRAKSFGS